MSGFTHFECGESYAEGNCEGCGQPMAKCPSYVKRQPLCHLEFMDYNGTVIHRASVAMDMDTVMAAADVFTFPFRAGVWAVRIQQGQRVKLHRRKGTGVAYRKVSLAKQAR